MRLTWVTGSRIPVEEGYTLYGLLLPKPKPKPKPQKKVPLLITHHRNNGRNRYP